MCKTPYKLLCLPLLTPPVENLKKFPLEPHQRETTKKIYLVFVCLKQLTRFNYTEVTEQLLD